MPPVTIQLPQPCAESWAAMTPTSAGRHCAACQQVVIDFTTFTDGELAAYFRQYAQPPCGRFRESQLNRPLLPAATPVAGWRRWLSAAVALLGLGSLVAPARAQTAPATTQTQPPKHGSQPTAQASQAACAQPTAATIPAERMLAGAPQMLMGRPAPPPAKHKPKPSKR